MPFQPRNPYYLRISEKIVIPLYVYLDERHLDWMSDLILQHVLADLRPNIVQKLNAETGLMARGSKKNTTVETQRGETYQFCYFLRKTEPHSVVIKTRNFVASQPQKKPDMPPPPLPRGGKRKASRTASKNVSEESRKKRKTKGKGKAKDDDPFTSNEEDDDDYEPELRSRRPRSAQGDEVVDPDTMDIDGADVEPFNQDISTLEIEDEEEKPKPTLQLKYQGFEIYGHCLCIVVEPWPPIRAASKPVTLQSATSVRAPSIVPSKDPASVGLAVAESRAKTPLFLPDFDRERSMTPAFFQEEEPEVAQSSGSRRRLYNLLDESLSDSEGSDDGGMYTFSQALNNTGENRAGAADDDEDMDVAAAMFFGDADEMREL